MIYSPSQTQEFLRCPRKWKLGREWEALEPWTPNRLMGEVLHAGLAKHYSVTWAVPSILNAKDASKSVFDKGWPEDEQAFSKEEYWKIAKACLKDALTFDVLQGGQMLAVEQEIGEERCRPDLVMMRGASADATDPQMGRAELTAAPHILTVVDWKYTHRCNPEWVSSRLKEYEHFWQLRHYCWRAQEEFGLPVTEYIVVLVIGTPKPTVRSITVPITQEEITRWHSSAKAVWARMEAGEESMALGPACSILGGCEFLGCWSWENPPEDRYIRKERVR